MRKFMPALLIIGLAGAGAARDRADRAPPATPAGPPVSCIPLSSIRSTAVRDDRTIDFMMRGNRPPTYRVVLPQACPDLGFEQRFAYATSLSQLCSSDIITVFSTAPVMRGASCGLAPFQPITLVRRR
jgi:hypothetical protein